MIKNFIEKHLVKFLVVFGVIWFIFMQYHGTWDGSYDGYDDEVFMYALITSVILYFSFTFTKRHGWDLKTKEFLNNNKNLTLLLIVLLALGLAFYWYELRPTQVKKECYKKSINTGFKSTSEADIYYKYCLRKSGL